MKEANWKKQSERNREKEAVKGTGWCRLMAVAVLRYTRCKAAAIRSTGSNARSRTDFSLHNSQSQWKNSRCFWHAEHAEHVQQWKTQVMSHLNHSVLRGWAETLNIFECCSHFSDPLHLLASPSHWATGCHCYEEVLLQSVPSITGNRLHTVKESMKSSQDPAFVWEVPRERQGTSHRSHLLYVFQYSLLNKWKVFQDLYSFYMSPSSVQ